MPHAVVRLDVAGRELTVLTEKLLRERGRVFPARLSGFDEAAYWYDASQHVKETYASVPLVHRNAEGEAAAAAARGERRQSSDAGFNTSLRERLRSLSDQRAIGGCGGGAAGGGEEKFVLPDGKTIVLGSERFEVAEALFWPRRASGAEEATLTTSPGGVHACTFQAIERCDACLRGALYRNVVLAGGSTLFPGFAERLARELAALTKLPPERLWMPPGLPARARGAIAECMEPKVKIVATPERKYGGWIGGSVLASLSAFQSVMITKEQYEETGPAIAHRQKAVSCGL